MKLEDISININFNPVDKVVVDLTAKFETMELAQQFIDRLKLFIKQEIIEDRSKHATN